jgi:hypothetical protein
MYFPNARRDTTREVRFRLVDEEVSDIVLHVRLRTSFPLPLPHELILKNVVFWDVTPCGTFKNCFSEVSSASVVRVGQIGTLPSVTRNRRRLCGMGNRSIL